MARKPSSRRAARARRAAIAEGRAARHAFARDLEALLAAPARAPRAVPWAVHSFSGRRDVLEQVATLRAFVAHVGRPRRFAILSDGSHTPAERELLARADPCAEVRDWREVARGDLPRAVRAYAAAHPMGRKLACLLSLEADGPTAYLDADVLTFPGAADLALPPRDGRPRYLPDCGPYLDLRLLRDPHEGREPINGGVLLLCAPLDWEPALARLDALDGAFAFHSEQTLLHLAVHAAGGRPLDRGRHVISRRDEFAREDAFAGAGIALRHYTTPVRHKLFPAVASTGCDADTKAGSGSRSTAP